MANIQKGTVGVVWGVGTVQVTGSSVGTNKPQSFDLSREGEERAIKGQDGDTVCRVFYDPVDKLSLEVVPSGTSKVDATTQFKLPQRGDLITITTGTLVDTAVGGIGGTLVSGSNYIFVGGNKRITVDQEARLTMNLERNANNLAAIS